MKKLILAGLALVLFSFQAHAQENSLFPELQGQFKPAAKKVLPKQRAEGKETAVKLDEEQASNETENSQGKISLSMENIQGTMAYAKNYSYCFSDMTLRNDTTQKLDKLTIILLYGKTPSRLSFSGIDKKSSQKQKFAMVGEDCALIQGTPEYKIEECKLGTMSKKACEGRFQFTPPK